MKRRSLFGLLGLGLCHAKAQGAVGDANYTHHLLQFNKAYCDFLREYFACTPNATDVSQCEGAMRGRIDYGSYIKCTRLADKVFPK